MFTLCVIPAFAGPQSMEISTQATQAEYELSFPADIEIPWMSQSADIGEVKAEKMLIEPGKTVKVSVSSQNGYKLVNQLDTTKSIGYTLIVSDIAFMPGDYGKSFPLSVEVENGQWLQASSGRHSDILTFTAEYTNQ